MRPVSMVAIASSVDSSAASYLSVSSWVGGSSIAETNARAPMVKNFILCRNF